MARYGKCDLCGQVGPLVGNGTYRPQHDAVCDILWYGAYKAGIRQTAAFLRAYWDALAGLRTLIVAKKLTRSDVATLLEPLVPLVPDQYLMPRFLEERAEWEATRQ